ncbi:MAG TPA: SAM-dependent methyltransferase, partial [Leeuwenhoekiella sp.]|nr:SAM-dependent methyltransferase [Leeuwenhoekiella sp.]
LVEWEEQYHSMHGAIQEGRHVFLKTGLDYWLSINSKKKEIHILEIGFGTGLNALLTAVHVAPTKITTYYEGVEAYPVQPEEIAQLNYVTQLKRPEYNFFFQEMHDASWGEQCALQDRFHLKKRQERFENIQDAALHDLIYFDAFGAQVQPELWDVTIFKKMYEALKNNGVLVTYSAKGSVRRAMQEVGFTVERLPGPPGKREMLRAVKL